MVGQLGTAMVGPADTELTKVSALQFDKSATPVPQEA